MYVRGSYETMDISNFNLGQYLISSVLIISDSMIHSGVQLQNYRLSQIKFEIILGLIYYYYRNAISLTLGKYSPTKAGNKKKVTFRISGIFESFNVI